ncbi:MAG: hypothetical protein AABW52_03985 [Nanoarchaeota archaeon]
MDMQLIKKIKEKKTLSNIDDSFVEKFIILILKQNSKLEAKYKKNLLKEKDREHIVKLVRNELNKRYGQFWEKTVDRDTKSELELELHSSTRERERIYPEVYEKIFEITGKPKKILDLGAGLNVLSYDLIGKNVYYYVNELTEKDCEIISNYLKENKYKFEMIKGDVTNTDIKLQEADVCFLFKLLDSLDVKDHKTSEELIKRIKANYIVISFSNLSIRGAREMKYPQRGWIERMLERLNYKYTKIEYTEETFYVVEKE